MDEEIKDNKQLLEELKQEESKLEKIVNNLEQEIVQIKKNILRKELLLEELQKMVE